MAEQKQLEPGKSNPREAFSDRLDELNEAFAALYIHKNASGRNKFREKWPEIAAYVFSEKLIACDDKHPGDFDERKILEEETDLRRIEFKNILTEIETESVASGVLKLDYIGSIIDKVGPVIAPYLYADKIIEKARPGLNFKRTTPEPAKPVVADVEQRVEEKKILQNEPEAAPAPMSTPVAASATPSAKPLPPKGTLTNLFNYRKGSGPKSVNAA
jgi:hypothetical protein